jgi:hypothetical protein
MTPPIQVILFLKKIHESGAVTNSKSDALTNSANTHEATFMPVRKKSFNTNKATPYPLHCMASVLILVAAVFLSPSFVKEIFRLHRILIHKCTMALQPSLFKYNFHITGYVS